MVALFAIQFRSLFFDVEKRRQCSEVMATPHSNCMVSRAINDEFEFVVTQGAKFPRSKDSENYDALSYHSSNLSLIALETM